MANPTYPGTPTTVVDGDKLLAHRFMKNPNVVQRALFDLTRERFLGDFLLTARYNVVGGAILFENGEPVYAADESEIVAPGAEYPLTTYSSGVLAAAQIVKRGQAAEITDEAIANWAFDPVQRALQRLANSQIRQNDELALSVIQSRVQRTFAATGSWQTSADGIIETMLLATADAAENMYNLGEQTYDYNTIVLKPTQFARVAGKLLTSNYLPRETNNAIESGIIPDYMGKAWVQSPNVPFSDPFVVDRGQLGGIGFQDLGGGYNRSDNYLESKTIRDEKRDKYDVQVRRVAVPVVRDPLAGFRITGPGL